VYVSAVTAEGRTYTGVTNIGIKPTVGGSVPLAETWIPGFSGDLYGQKVPVSPVAFLRPERRFDSLEELKAQIAADGARALQFPADPRRRAVLFDFDDTLQNRARAFTAWSESFIRRRLPHIGEQERRRMAQRMTELNGGGYAGYPRFCELVRREFGLEGPADGEFMADLRTRFPLPTALLPGVAEGLAALRAAGWLVGVVTNGDSLMQNRKLDASGLRPLLDTALVSGDEGVRKPDPELFRRAAARLGVDPARCVFVGDHPVNDMEGAAAAGMRPVFMAAGGVFPPPEGVERVSCMAELVALLEGGETL
jgi:putative hydrolase of the HAD superfamily